MTERLDSISRWLLVGLFGLLPFFFVPISWVGLTQGKVALVSVALAAIVVISIAARLKERAVRIPSTSILAIGALIPLAYALSSAATGFASISLFGSGSDADTLALVCIEFALFVVSAALFTGQPARLADALRAFFAGSLVLLLLHIAHVMIPSLTLGGVFGTEVANAFGTWHEFAMLAGLVLVLGIALQHSSVARGHWTYVLYACALLAALVLVTAGFFDVWAGVFVALMILVLVRSYKSQAFRVPQFWRSQWLPIATAILAVFFLVFGAYIVQILPDRFAVANTEVRPSWEGTFGISKRALTEPMEVVFGSGPNTFTREWGLHKPLSVNQTFFWNTSFATGVASIPTSFITTGIFGVLSWIALIASVLFAVARSWLSRERTAADILSIAVIYLLSFHALSVPGTTLSIVTFLMLGLWVAALVPQYFKDRAHALGFDTHKMIVASVASIIFALIVLGAIFGNARVLLSEWWINRGIVAYNTTRDSARASELITQAIGIYPSDRAHRAAVELGLQRLRELINSADPDQETARTQLQTTLEATIQHGLSAVSLGGNDYQNWLGLAGLYAELAGANVEGAYDNARAAYERALLQSPTSPLPYLNLARLEMLQEKPDAALPYLAEAVRLKSDYAAAYYVASQAYVMKRELENALKAAASAIQYASSDSGAWYNYGLIAYEAQEFSQAAAALEQALALEDRFANAMYVLGLSYYELDRTDDAIKMFEALRELDPEQKAVQAIIDNLKNKRPPVPPTAPSATSR